MDILTSACCKIITMKARNESPSTPVIKVDFY